MTFHHEHHHYFHPAHAEPGGACAITLLLGNILTKVNHMSAELDTLTSEVSETNTVVDSAIVLLKGLKQKLDEAGTDPVKLKELSDSLNAQQDKLAAAIAENTPVA